MRKIISASQERILPTYKKIAMGAALPASGLLNIVASTFPNIIVYSSNKDVPKLQNGNGGSDGDTQRLVPRKTVLCR